MEDDLIIGLYWAREENAIQETKQKYGRLCMHIARNILASREDQEECINDTYFTLWNRIPAERPSRFAVFVSRITRNLALKKYAYVTAAKRNPQMVTSMEELGDCVSGRESVESELEAKQIQRAINSFLWQLEEEKRVIFIRRYWYFDSIAQISQSTGFSQSKIKSMLYELRKKLRIYLESEGVSI